MTAILAIAGNTMREARRHKIFYSILFFALAIIAFSFVFTNLTVATQDRIMRDVGTGAIDFFGVLLAIFLGVSMINREVDRRTVYTIVTKPIRRADFVIGKFLGLNGVLLVTIGVMFLTLVAVLWAFPAYDEPNVGTLLWFVLLRLAELSILVAFATLTSTFTTSALSAFFTIALYIIGHLSSDLVYFGSKSDSAVVSAVAKGIFYAVPNLSRFSVAEQIAYNLPVDATQALLSIGYALLFSAAFVAFAVLVFERRDFK